MSRCCILIAIFLFSLNLYAQYPDGTDRLERQATQKLEKGDLDGSIVDLTRLIDVITRPELSRYGSSVHAAGHPVSSSAAIGSEAPRAAILIDPRAADAYLKRSWAYIRKRDTVRALNDLNAAIRMSPRNANAYFLWATVHLARKDRGSALLDYKMALRLDPEYARSYAGIGMLMLDDGDADAALGNYDMAIAIEPQNADLYSYRADAKRELGDNEGAFSDYQASLRLNPNSSLALRGLSMIFLAKRDYENAMKNVNRAIELDTASSRAYSIRGLIHFIQGRAGAAKLDFDKAVSFDPELVSEIEYNKYVMMKERQK